MDPRAKARPGKFVNPLAIGDPKALEHCMYWSFPSTGRTPMLPIQARPPEIMGDA